MTRFVIDPMALLAIARSGRAPDPAHRLVGPNSLRTQALQLLLDEVTRGELADRDALRLHETMTELKIRLTSPRPSGKSITFSHRLPGLRARNRADARKT